MTSPTRPLGSSGLDITTVGFGAWSGGAEAGEPAERLYFQRRGLARASHRERSGISAGPRRCPIGPPAAVLQQWEHPMPSQRNDLQHSAVVVIDMANDFVYSGGVIADAGGPDYQERAQRLIAPLGRLLAAARRAGVTVVRSEEHTSELQSRLHLVCRLLLEKKTSYPSRRPLPRGRPRGPDRFLDRITHPARRHAPLAACTGTRYAVLRSPERLTWRPRLHAA